MKILTVAFMLLLNVLKLLLTLSFVTFVKAHFICSILQHKPEKRESVKQCNLLQFVSYSTTIPGILSCHILRSIKCKGNNVSKEQQSICFYEFNILEIARIMGYDSFISCASIVFILIHLLYWTY